MPSPETDPPERLVGILSDTHGPLPPAALEALRGVDLILHAGDVGPASVLEELATIAPVYAVRGNTDGGWARRLPATEAVEVGGVMLYMLHDLETLDLDPAAAGFAAVITGHTHRPVQRRYRGVLYLNPGSAAFPRTQGPPTVAHLRIRGADLHVTFVPLLTPEYGQ